MRESRALLRAANLRANNQQISKAAFERRKDWWIENAKDGKFLADPDAKDKGRPNPMSDPAMMEGMMGMMKGNVAMMVPQSLIMGWINAFFSGYVISESSGHILKMPLETNRDRSETPIPAHASIQANAASWCRHKGPGCAVGEQLELVLSHTVWVAARLQLHLGQQQW